MEPLLSIITVTYNASDVIDATLESIKDQGIRDFEYIVVDGASSDDTVDKVKGSGIKDIQIVSESDSGIYHAMNKGLAMARGRFVLFLNAGDSFHDSTVLEKFRKATVDFPEAGVIYGQTIIVDKERNYISERHLTAPNILTFDSFKNGMVVCHQAFFARRTLTQKFDVKYKLSSDYDWCVKILKKSKENVYLGNEPIIDYLYEGITTKNHSSSLKERFGIMSKHYGFIGTSLRHIRFAMRYLNNKKANSK